MANIGTTELSNSLATIVAARALGYLKANTRLAQIVNRDFDNEVAVHGQTVDITSRGTLSVNDKAQDTVITLQTPSDSKVSVTLNKHKEVSFMVEDPARAMARPDQLAGYMEDGIAVMAEQIDNDLAALYSGLSQTVSATGGLGEATFRESARLLNAAKAPSLNRWAVLHEDALSEFQAIERAVNRDFRDALGGASAQFPFEVQPFMGFNVVLDQKINVASLQAKNLFMHRNALILVTRPLPQAPGGAGVIQRVMSEDGIGLRVTVSYDHDHLGLKISIDVLYGVAELRDNHGVVVSTTEV